MVGKKKSKRPRKVYYWGQDREFGGRKFKFSSAHNSKRRAEDAARALRVSGRTYRIVYNIGEKAWWVYKGRMRRYV